jgi:cell division protein FtsB
VIVLGALILICALVVFVIFNRNGVLNYLSLRRQKEELAREVDSLQAVHDSLSAEVERLRADSAYIERMVRELLGWGRPGELIIRFQRPDSLQGGSP